MLPLGVLELGKRSTRFTPDEQQTMMTLWSIARSPLIMGGDLRKLDPATQALLTNDEVLAVNQHSTGNRPLFNREGLIGWMAEVPRSQARYLALFNTRDVDATVGVDLKMLGLNGRVNVRDLWARSAADAADARLDRSLPVHGSALYRLG